MSKIFISVLLYLSALVVGFGQTIEDFNLVNVVDGKTVSLKDYSSSEGVVIIFMMNDCPFDEYYIQRIKSLNSTKVPVLLVNAHPDPSESLDNMTKRAKQAGINIPYLADKDQKLMLSLGAHKSTEAFLLKNTNGKFSVIYHGAIDDNPQVATDVKHGYLREAINKMLAGQQIDKIEVRPAGCSIRKK
jgi:peroxiredoxin